MSRGVKCWEHSISNNISLGHCRGSKMATSMLTHLLLLLVGVAAVSDAAVVAEGARRETKTKYDKEKEVALLPLLT